MWLLAIAVLGGVVAWEVLVRPSHKTPFEALSEASITDLMVMSIDAQPHHHVFWLLTTEGRKVSVVGGFDVEDQAMTAFATLQHGHPSVFLWKTLNAAGVPGHYLIASDIK